MPFVALAPTATSYSSLSAHSTAYVRNDSRRKIYSRGGLASTTSCAYLYTCPFWISVRLYLRGRSKSDKQSRVFPRENKTKVNYNKMGLLNNSEDSKVANSQVTKPCACMSHAQCALQGHHCNTCWTAIHKG